MEGDSIELTITGTIGTTAMFTASDVLQIVRPHLRAPNGGEELMAGMFTTVTWDTPVGWVPTATRIQFSTDTGESWTEITDSGTGGKHLWHMPLETHEAVLLRVEVYDAYGFLGRDVSDAPFSITQATTGIDERTPLRPGLRQNAPNPFAASTVIGYALDRQSRVTLSVFNVQGQRVRVLEDATVPPGAHEARWDGRDDSGHRVAAGVYLYHLRTDTFQETKRMLVTR
jgi:hypothetical protein